VDAIRSCGEQGGGKIGKNNNLRLVECRVVGVVPDAIELVSGFFVFFLLHSTCAGYTAQSSSFFFVDLVLLQGGQKVSGRL
jgi:hypothetical protein